MHLPATRNLHPPATCPECGQPVEAGIVRHWPCFLQHEQDRLAAQDARDQAPRTYHPMKEHNS